MLGKTQALGFQSVFPQSAEHIRQTLRTVYHGEAAAPAEQILCGVCHICKGAAVFRAGGAEGIALGSLSRSGGVVGRVAHHIVHAAGRGEDLAVLQIAVMEAAAVEKSAFAEALFRKGDGALLQLDVGKGQFALPRKEQQTQQACSCAEVADLVALAGGGEIAQQERIGAGLEKVGMIIQGKSTAANGLMQFHFIPSFV